jgi:hypothetical protein
MTAEKSGERTGAVDLRSLHIDGRKAAVVLVAVGVLAVLRAGVVGRWESDGTRHFWHAYLLSFCYVISLSVGALFFVLVQHLTRAGWSVVVRRLAEIIAAALPATALLFVPIAIAVLLGNTSLYEWNSAEARAADHLLAKKAAWLNAPRFVAFSAAYLAIWGGLAWYFFRKSVQQDETGDRRLSLLLQSRSAPGVLLFALAVCFAAFDWLMSLDPHWFSTIFGVYFFAGSMVGFLALLIVLAAWVQQRGALQRAITVEHYHDLGKLLFGFVFFWGYIAFSQYLLIWYANLPEETGWIARRQEHGWQWVSLWLLFGHLLVPFLGLMSRAARRNRTVLVGWAGALLVMHWFDLYWLVGPQLSAEVVPLGLVDALCLVGVVSCYGSAVLSAAGSRSLVPLHDPYLDESLAFENV